MSVCFPFSQSSISAVVVKGRTHLLMSSNICGLWSQGKSSLYSSSLCPSQSQKNHVGLSCCARSSMGQTIRGYLGSCCSKQRGNLQICSSIAPRKRHHEISLACQSLNMRLLVPNQKKLPKDPENGKRNDQNVCKSNVAISHGKKVYTDYSVIGIPGDGRCLFRSVAHGACLRSGKPPPSESHQRQLADELRSKVADEFIKRREETEWFIEGDFDTYISQIRKPHVWGGEPELFIASHVLKMPITVYMYDRDAGGLISIAEYGQEYGKENPIRVLYHGFGHYDALEIPRRKGPKPRL
ncbi:OTU domain-containing protein At3g57810 isoform X2 [Arachis ipaensis]|uniref:OTU domain-containing protein At3g57810 isoform X2 n=1 Tax=Arachis ipaensis TaxID=130454 RepID=UPI000A2B9136|nr:OTU domain-containing protein At3g57810 isoform X2 [Arachis ipaensis]XP_025633293.1 OTU domain-containing protein At3g57810 isoform X3 [Arachis hypogaea]